VQEESLYEKLVGMVYKHKKSDKMYIRIASPKSRLQVESAFFRNGKKIDYSKIENYLYANEKKDYERSDRQAVEGMDIDTILQLNYNLEKIVMIERVK
jgi:CRISPR/Cas system-associated protein Cas5 (RAMP superfamily)